MARVPIIGKSSIACRPAREAFDPNRKEIYVATDKDGNCSKCGACCTCLLPVSPGELRNIKTYVARNNIKPSFHGIVNAHNIDMVCPFQTAAGCTIYPVRPAICKSFKCNMGEEKISQNRKWFHDRYETVNMWEAVFKLAGHSISVINKDGQLTGVSNIEFMERLQKEGIAKYLRQN